MANRRNFLLATALFGSIGYTYHRGLRYPRLGFEHRLATSSATGQFATVEFSDAILRNAKAYTKNKISSRDDLQFRAIAPEPSISLIMLKSGSFRVEISNITPNASLKVEGEPKTKIDEQATATNRYLKISGKAGQALTLRWNLEQTGANFAVIGDTGAGLELKWALQRAHQLGAQFLLHLGDFNYGPNEYNRAIELFESAPLPCYVSIGNHDYNDSGLIYQHFLDNIGPMNHSFSVAGTRFVNVDTAVNFLPASGGQRGRLFDYLRQDTKNYDDNVFFTHRPFVDIRPGQDHTISGIGEMDWLATQIKGCGRSHFLCGHVHRSGETDYKGLRQYTAGEGLGFEDIVHQKQVSKLLLGTVELGQPATYKWHHLDMPWAMHRSHKNETKLIAEHSISKLQWYKQMLKKQPQQQSVF